ncbi:hypothetical protein HF086_006423 [Spodoptera exigua]|uniref:Uncharacterized protein n=1 Tax=Spodoptera exigua TaxID=7107 RepID=A0A922MVS6_SPOEX|nr:hypothetical protein HF086_006423 [Spodoptera exigua]
MQFSLVFTDGQMKMMKNIQRLQRASFKKMSAYGLFVVDATLPLQLAGIISAYTITQIQFVLTLNTCFAATVREDLFLLQSHSEDSEVYIAQLVYVVGLLELNPKPHTGY